MEDWEVELEYHTWDAYNKAVTGKEDTEEFEVNEEDFKSDVNEMLGNVSDWEDVTYGEK